MNLVNLDRQVERIRVALEPIAWLETAYGRASTQYRDSESGGVITYPAVYKDKGQYIDAMPNDKIKSHCFFITDDVKAVNFERGLRAVNYEAPVDILVYYDFRKLGVDTTTEHLCQEVLHKLKKIAGYEIVSIQYELKKVFEGYSVDSVATQYLMRPFGGFRIQGLLTFTEDVIC